jgi:uncharacterized membrane protein
MDLPYIAAFLGGLAIFFATHYFSAFRSRADGGLAQRLGRGPYMGLYSLLTLVGFVLMVWGFGNIKPWIPIWTPPYWTRHVAMLLMLPAMVLIVAAYAPTGFMKKAIKHPMLAAVKLWALAHLTANGDLGSIILFGAFLIYGVVDRIAVKRRGDVGAANANPTILGDMIALAVGGALYAAIIFYLHPLLFGVPVLVSGPVSS